MTRDAFMKELEYLLQDVQDEEKDEALQYYRDYFEEAGPENEKQVSREFGSPERVAAIIRSDIAGHLEDGGEFTESGYQDERFRDPGYQVAPCLDVPEPGAGRGGPEQKNEGGRAAGQTPPRTSRGLKIVLAIILCMVAFPVVWGIGEGLWGLAGCILAVLLVLLVALGLVTAACLIGGVILVPCGLVMAFGNLWTGLLMFGAGMVSMGIGLLGLAVSLLFYGRFVPFLICSAADCLNRLFHRGRRKQV